MSASAPPLYNALILSPSGLGLVELKQLRSNPPHRPLLDQEAFQQLLAAAYTLQDQNDHLLAKAIKTDFPQAEPLTSVTVPQPEMHGRHLQRLARPARRAFQRTTRSHDITERRRISHSNELFWRAATVVAIAAVLALFLGTSVDRFSPLPAGLAPPSEIVEQQLPFRGAARTVTLPPQNGVVGAKPFVIEPDAPTKAAPIDQEVVSDQPSEVNAAVDSAPRTTVNRAHSAYEDEADVVAQNTVVRYSARSGAPGVPPQKKP